MSESVRPDMMRDKARLKLVRRVSAQGACTEGVSHDDLTASNPAATPVATETPERLISPPDAAISKILQDQTRIVLATLSPLEQLVLRMRFGIGQPGEHAVADTQQVLAPDQISFIEATALRKLRHPNRSARLGSTDCG